jgi:hypothetical protein
MRHLSYTFLCADNKIFLHKTICIRNICAFSFWFKVWYFFAQLLLVSFENAFPKLFKGVLTFMRRLLKLCGLCNFWNIGVYIGNMPVQLCLYCFTKLAFTWGLLILLVHQSLAHFVMWSFWPHACYPFQLDESGCPLVPVFVHWLCRHSCDLDVTGMIKSFFGALENWQWEKS